MDEHENCDGKKYFCTKPHLFGESGMYHYDDEVIYEKHLIQIN